MSDTSNPRDPRRFRFRLSIGLPIVCTLLFLVIVPLSSAKVGGGDVRFEVKGIGNVTFSHDGHVTKANLKCTDCHTQLYVTSRDAPRKKVTMAEMQKGQSCGACHDGKKSFSVKGDCMKCHKK